MESGDAVMKPEVEFEMVMNGEEPPSMDSIFDGWGMIFLRNAVIIGTGLRFVKPTDRKASVVSE